MGRIAEIFSYEGHEVRTVVEAGQPWFVAADVCAILGHSNPTMAVSGLDEDERGLRNVETPSGVQSMVAVNEAGLYSLVLRSRKPEAKAFKRWITHEVLPSIRQHGMYATPQLLNDPEHLLRVTERMVEEHRARVEAEARLVLQAPKVELHDTLMSAEGDYSLRDAAQILSRDHGIETGQNRLAKYLRTVGWVDRRGTPYQAQVDLDRLAVRTSVYSHPHTGEPTLTTQVRITPKGLAELYRLMSGKTLVAVG